MIVDCSLLTGLNSKQIVLQGQHWHSKDSCFCCSLCRKALLGQPITIHHGLLFCSEACSLEKESALSSSGSDSSDSAFISAPSPDSTPISRARNSSPDCSSETARTQRDGCEERGGALGKAFACHPLKVWVEPLLFDPAQMKIFLSLNVLCSLI